MNTTKYYYKDLDTQKIHFTRARFIGWTEPTGLLNARYAKFLRKSDILYIPWHCLTKETREVLPPRPQESEVTA